MDTKYFAKGRSLMLFMLLLLSVLIFVALITITETQMYNHFTHRVRYQGFYIRDLEPTSSHNDGKFIEYTTLIQRGVLSSNHERHIINSTSKSQATQIILRYTTSGNKTAATKPIVQVGYFEGSRRFWTYTNIFQPPVSPRTCNCFSEEREFDAVVTLEKNASKTGKFDILFIPQDVGFNKLRRNTWNVILSSSSPNQRRIYATFEGANKLKYLTLYPYYINKSFHWSWTYHSQSDFPMPYGEYVLHDSDIAYKTSQIQANRNWAEGKKDLITWMSTWSVTSWKREAFVNELQNHLEIDLFGKKFKRCPRNSEKCEHTIKQYKFYLALENSCCSEYITEKFWRTLAWDIVPIVIGAPRSEYERLAPPNSFIYADDFSSVGEFTKYINFLNTNDEEYNKFFLWKEKGKAIVNYPTIANQIVKTKVPPDSFFYSCNAVCRVTNAYMNEKSLGKHTNSTAHSYFYPNINWWFGSCTKCGKHDWISKFNN